MAKVLATACLLLEAALLAPPAMAASDQAAAHAPPSGNDATISPEKKAWFQRTLDHILDESSTTAQRSEATRNLD